MALVQCRECEALISDKSSACVKCGAPREAVATEAGLSRRPPAAPDKPRRAWPWIVAAAVGCILFVGFVGSNSPEGQDKARARGVISLCWEEQGRKSLPPDAARFAASACERMESDFRQKYGVSP